MVKDSLDGMYSYIAKGKMTIKGIAKDAEVKFNYMGVEDKDMSQMGMGKMKVGGFEGTTVIDRTQFGIGGAGGLGEKVTINITLEVMQPIK
jgi:polyisoprenoid-binding protein YceI